MKKSSGKTFITFYGYYILKMVFKWKGIARNIQITNRLYFQCYCKWESSNWPERWKQQFKIKWNPFVTKADISSLSLVSIGFLQFCRNVTDARNVCSHTHTFVITYWGFLQFGKKNNDVALTNLRFAPFPFNKSLHVARRLVKIRENLCLWSVCVDIILINFDYGES